MNHGTHLLTALRTAVGLEMLQLASLNATERIDLARRGADTLQAGADVLQFGSAGAAQQRLGAASFAALARALAAMAYQPGGVTFDGVHWCVDHRACVEAQAAADTSLPDPVRLCGRPVTTVRGF